MQVTLEYPNYNFVLDANNVMGNFDDDIFEGNRINNFQVMVKNIITRENAGVV